MIRKIKNMLISVYQKLRVAKYKFLSTANKVKGKGHFVQPVLLAGEGTIVFGKDVYLGTQGSPFFYSGYCFIDARKNDAVIVLGDRVWSNNNLTIISQEAGISIGSDTIIGTNVEIYDSDFHDIHPARRKASEVVSARVEIGENVWIGSNVKILKGVKIGSNSIIGNNSVVTKDIPANSVWGGVPAVFLKKLEYDQSS
jgi:acetyltransferase-like isoleucine patch superfamily enzyme